VTSYVDWPVPDEPVGLAVLLPGRRYPVAMPLLTFAGRAALQHGWRVRAVEWTGAPDPDSASVDDWVGDRLLEAVGDEQAGPVLVVAKSLGTRAARVAAEHRWDAVWLTPLLRDRSVVEGIAANPARQLLVGGTEDELAWDHDVAHELAKTGCEVLEVPGADHAMFVPDDAVRTAEVHLWVTRAVSAFLGGAAA
jgi:hypothetical protein